MLAIVGLEGYEDRYPHELSGGQQQRVALARALAPEPALVLLDEPLSNLDAQVRLRLRQELRDILKQAGTSAIFVTHDREEALSIADRLGVMADGRLQQLGTPEEVYRQPATRFVAEFVTQGNFLPARRRARGWETELGLHVLSTGPAGVPAVANAEAGEIAIPPEAIVPVPDAAGTITVRDRQFLGREYRYRLLLPSGRELVARTASDAALQAGDRIRLQLDPGLLQWFPAQDESPTRPPELVRQA